MKDYHRNPAVRVKYAEDIYHDRHLGSAELASGVSFERSFVLSDISGAGGSLPFLRPFVRE